MFMTYVSERTIIVIFQERKGISFEASLPHSSTFGAYKQHAPFNHSFRIHKSLVLTKMNFICQPIFKLNFSNSITHPSSGVWCLALIQNSKLKKRDIQQRDNNKVRALEDNLIE